MIKKFREFQKINEETGIRDITKTVAGYKEAEIYFHQDLDGVVSCIAMKEYLKRYGIKTVDVHIIQYGGMEYAIKATQEGRLPVLVDFAHGKSMFKIHTDHHDTQSGTGETKSGSFKSARSNAETISGEISPTDIFTHTDIELVRTVDSADFFKRGITPEMVQNSIFNVDKTKSGAENRYIMGFTVNRLLLAYKNKSITVKSVDGKRDYDNRNFLECLVLDSNASLYSMYNNIRHYINNATTKDKLGVLATPETLAKNLAEYTEKMKNYPKLSVDKNYNISMQDGGGTMFAPGSYDRYVIFKNNPEVDFHSILWPMGLLQVSANPFKEKSLKDVNLGEIAKEVLAQHQNKLEKIFISIEGIKHANEIQIQDIEKRGGDYEGRVGFTFADILAFYKDNVKQAFFYTDEDGKQKREIRKFDIEAKTEYNDFIKKAMDTLYSKISKEELSELKKYKISAWDIIMANSGGHPSITNISGFNYLAYNKEVTKILYGTDSYVDVMRIIQKEFVNVLKSRIDDIKSGKSIESTEKGWGASMAESKRHRRLK